MKKNIKVWRCPKCTKTSISISINKTNLAAKISCGSCGLFIEKKIKRIYDPIDVYGDFIDTYYKNPSEYLLRENDPTEINVDLVLITTQNIIISLSLNWKNLAQLKEDLNIDSDLDIRFLKLKLKELERKAKLDVKWDGVEKYWRKFKNK